MLVWRENNNGSCLGLQVDFLVGITILSELFSKNHFIKNGTNTIEVALRSVHKRGNSFITNILKKKHKEICRIEDEYYLMFSRNELSAVLKISGAT